MGQRAGEHWDKCVATRRGGEGSHIWDHQSEYHSEQDISFKFEVVKVCRTALERQVSETVNIKMRSSEGSKILNSKIEYNRCFIPSLTVLGQGGVAISPSKTKVKVAVPASVTIVPHIVQAIGAVKTCEGPTEGVNPVRTPTENNLTPQELSCISAPCSLTPHELSCTTISVSDDERHHCKGDTFFTSEA